MVIPKDSDRHSYLNKGSARNPGPGAYADGDGAQSARSNRLRSGGAFTQDKRETAFDKINRAGAEVPGAGNYDPPDMSRTQGASFGAGKRPEPGNSMPGPGAYNTSGAGDTAK